MRRAGIDGHRLRRARVSTCGSRSRRCAGAGIAYFDSNSGAEPLENAFRNWTWSRASVPGGTVVLYDVAERTAAQPANAPACPLALRFGPDARHRLSTRRPSSSCRRRAGASRGAPARTPAQGVRVVRTLEDAPFYSRSLLDTQSAGLRSHPRSTKASTSTGSARAGCKRNRCSAKSIATIPIGQFQGPCSCWLTWLSRCAVITPGHGRRVAPVITVAEPKLSLVR